MQLTMILNETLRLFSPISDQNREVAMDMKLGDLHIPKGLNLYFPRLAIHHDPELWGADVHEFKPERFVDGIAKASKNPFAFMPFSFGPRFCVGQGFALEEAKLVLVVILQRFRFHLSPNYRHAPYDKVTVKPKYGVPIVATLAFGLRPRQGGCEVAGLEVDPRVTSHAPGSAKSPESVKE